MVRAGCSLAALFLERPLLLRLCLGLAVVSSGLGFDQNTQHSGDSETDLTGFNSLIRQLSGSEDGNATNLSLTTTAEPDVVTTTAEVGVTTTTEAEAEVTTTTEAEVTTTTEAAVTTTTEAEVTTTTEAEVTTTAETLPESTSTEAPAATTVAATSSTDPAVGSGGGNESAADQAVSMRMTIAGVDYAALNANTAVRTEFISAIEAGIIQEVNSRGSLILSPSNVETQLQAASVRRLQLELQGLRGLQGSNGVIAESVITLPVSSTAADVTALVGALETAARSIESTVESRIKAITNVGSVTLDGATIVVSGAVASLVSSLETTTTIRRPFDIATAGAVRCGSAAATALATSLLAVLLF